MERIQSHREAGERYGILRFAVGLLTVVGIILLSCSALALTIGILGLTTNLVPAVNGIGAGIGVVWSLWLILAGGHSLVLGGLIRLLIHIEENTRASAQALEKIRSGMEPKAAIEVDRRSLFLS